ncbi:acetaldehyde dehydrogenase (acetylating) [Rhodococcus koreensis]|jgi:acetaldehyde dehydrogenase|uniref:acetaldehyde dehydrogenase (acetylating) n=1 Tax=Rhodococcus koreensis TaxID=99653 RepID=UPI00197D660D|nr:acetaldehyde dehydrogenase (acetylating) [Rhodococcus koreensis]QSE86659.1 acetaldehyde dehydrogenase (acetylating) [Rhodococcus koreensis]
MKKTKVAIIGSGNIGTDLMMKTMRSRTLEVAVLVGVDRNSDGLARAESLGIATTHRGLDHLVTMPEFDEIAVIFDATSAAAHEQHATILQETNKRVVDLTPAAVGPFVVPTVNLDTVAGESNVNMVTCGGQATVPIVSAISQVTPVHYAEIVASIASRSAGPGTRANIDEFTETTSLAVESVGGATRGKAIIILNPAEPPLMMRDTILCLCDDADEKEIESSVERMVAAVAEFVPGYRLKQKVQFLRYTPNSPLPLSEPEGVFVGLKVSVFLEVEGAAHYLPSYAGNLDIMTSAALRTAERIAEIHSGTGK